MPHLEECELFGPDPILEVARNRARWPRRALRAASNSSAGWRTPEPGGIAVLLEPPSRVPASVLSDDALAEGAGKVARAG